jgi:hypothetical protein
VASTEGNHLADILLQRFGRNGFYHLLYCGVRGRWGGILGAQTGETSDRGEQESRAKERLGGHFGEIW